MDRDGGADASPAVGAGGTATRYDIYTSLRSCGSIKNNIGEKKRRENEELIQYVLFRAIPTLGSKIGKPTLLVDARIPYGATVDIAKRNIRNTNGL